MKPLVHVNHFNEAMGLLMRIAKDEELYAVEVTIRRDGRVVIYGIGRTGTEWLVDGDLLPGGALPTPGTALASKQASEPNRPDSGGKTE